MNSKLLSLPLQCLRWYFTPPDFDNPEDARKALTINLLCFFGICVTVPITPYMLFSGASLSTLVFDFGFIYLNILVCPFLVRNRHIFAASLFWAITVWVGYTTLSLLMPAPLESHWIYFYLSSVIVGGMLLGRWYLIIHASACTLSLLTFFILYKLNIRLLPAILPPHEFKYLTAPIVGIITIVLTLFLALSEIERSLRLAREKLDDSQKSQKALREYQENLEQIINIRTHELKRSKMQAESASRAKGDFLARMSHEIRTPLNAILGFSQLLQKEKMSPSIDEKVTIISRSGEHLLGLINEVLEMSKIDAGRVEINEYPFNMLDLVKNVRAMLKFRSDLKGIALSAHIDESVPRYIIADEGKIRQVFINLLANAIKFTNHGKVVLRLAMKREAGNILTIHGQVEDTGEGISPDEISRIFTAFEQTSSGVRSQKGTGLGLAITKHYLEAMGGDISVQSEIGSGTCFTFHFAVKEPADVPPDEITGKIIGITKSSRVLVVDDNLDNRTVLRSILDNVGFETKEAIDGNDALSLYNDWKPDIIMMDLMMPVMDGYEAARLIRQNDPKTYIVAVTAAGLNPSPEKTANHDFDDIIIKPYKEKDIFDAIAKCGVEYIFEEVMPRPDNGTDDILPDDTPGSIPAELIERIRQNALKARPDLILEMLDEVRSHDVHAAKRIEDMINGFNYERLVEYLDAWQARG